MAAPEKPKYQFKRRRYGYGWVPTTPKGWLYTLIFAAVIIGAGMYFLGDEAAVTDQKLFAFFVVLALDLLFLFWITSKTAPKPRWRWGKRDRDNPEEDY